MSWEKKEERMVIHRWYHLLLAVLPAVLIAVGIPWPVIVYAAGSSSGRAIQPIGSGPEAPTTSPTHPASPQVKLELDVFWVTVALALFILAFVIAVLLINIFKFSAKPSEGGESRQIFGRITTALDAEEEPKQVYGNRFIEISWTLIPGGILLVSFILTAIAIGKVDLRPTVSAQVAQLYPPVTVDVIGHQWWWEFRYPQYHFVTANEMHVPVHSVITLHITSVDVIHSFMVPQLTRQMDATPNNLQTIYFQADHTGVFPGQCYEYCGDGHAWMQFRVVVQTQKQFRAWARHMAKPAPLVPSSKLALQGEQIFMTVTCASCHTIDGTPAQGKVGPNLTHVGSRWGIAGGVLPMSERNLELWINHDDAYKPGVLMPQFNLSSKDVKAVATYLYGLK
jgi:cytochrome c oxidase subunit 2